MALPTFEQVNSTFFATGYAVTNEEPAIFRDFLRGRIFEKGASIASGGEVVLGSILPRCNEVIAVDHSARSLAVFWTKIALLHKFGPVDTKKIFTDTYKGLVEHVRLVLDLVPEYLRPHVTPDFNGSMKGMTSYDFTCLRREWYFLHLPALRVSAKKLDKLTIVQGDLSDIKGRGPFDLFYVSNAMEHSNRNGKKPSFKLFEEFLKDDGLMLAAFGGTVPFEWEKVGDVTGYRTTWNHLALKKKPFELKAEKVTEPAGV